MIELDYKINQKIINSMSILKISRQNVIDKIISNIKLGVDLSHPENNVLEFAKALGIEVYEVDLSNAPGVNGIIKYTDEVDISKKDPKIFINKDLNLKRKTFTLAHEIGHYVLHPGTKYRIDKFDYTLNTLESLQETEANYFAASLLVPSEKLHSIIQIEGIKNLRQIADYFRVSEEVIKNRLKWIHQNKTAMRT